MVKNDITMQILLRFRFLTRLHIAVVLFQIGELLGDVDTDKLLARLKDKNWLWFGEKAKQSVCAANKVSLECFNLRRDSYESILERAGLPENVVLSKKLVVTFKAEKEGVDVCGKTTILEAVQPFELSPEGLTTNLNAEAYRNQPMVQWEADGEKLYSLIYFDVGLLKMRGWWYDIKKEDSGNLTGKINLRYQPPANPAPVQNPILIVLLEQKYAGEHKSDKVDKTCTHTSPSSADADLCRSTFQNWISEMTVVGLQVYYTNGQTMYEKYRACTESYPCDEKCIGEFRKYAEKPQKPITFLNLHTSTLDHYVNVQFYSLDQVAKKDLPNMAAVRQMAEAPPEGEEESKGEAPPSGEDETRYVDVRPRPGDNMQLRNSDTLLQANEAYIKINVEIGAPIKSFSATDQFYSILIVDQDAPGMSTTPWGHYYRANLQFPDILKTGQDLHVFQDFTPPDGIHQYHILLFRHPSKVTAMTHLCADPFECSGWNLHKMPRDHILVGISWLRASMDDEITCPSDGEGGCLIPQPLSSNVVGSYIVPKVATLATKTTTNAESKLKPTPPAASEFSSTFKVADYSVPPHSMSTTAALPTSAGNELGWLPLLAMLFIAVFVENVIV